MKTFIKKKKSREGENPLNAQHWTIEDAVVSSQQSLKTWEDLRQIYSMKIYLGYTCQNKAASQVLHNTDF